MLVFFIAHGALFSVVAIVMLAEARALLDALDPTFGGWYQIVPEQTHMPAWRACKYKFTAACAALGI